METWQEQLADVWAKSPLPGQPRGELLTEHSEEALLRLKQLQERFPGLPAMVEDERLWHRLFWACTLHDLGKATAPFQNLLRDHPTKERAQKAWRPHRHEVGSLAFVPWVTGADDEDALWICAAIVSHHRDGDDIERLYDPREAPEDSGFPLLFAGMSDSVLAGIGSWLATLPEQRPAGAGFSALGVEPARALPAVVEGAVFRASGATNAALRHLRAYNKLRNRLKQESGDSLLNRRALVYRALMLLADRLGSAHAKKLATLHLPSVAELLSGKTPRDHQRSAAELDGSLVLTAPTGSGKTEAALLWARRQQEHSHRPTLLYLLPYQASLNAMQERLEQQDVLGPPVGLLHGKATQALFQRFLSEEYSSRDPERAAKLAQNLTRLQQPAARVATPYQLLRAAYRLKGYEMLWATMADILIIIDEIHAYEAKRLGLFLGLLAALVRSWNVRVCAITATMPSWLRALLQDAIGAQGIIASDADFTASRRHRLHLREGEMSEPAVLDWIAAMVRRGESVLVAVNTVRRAQTTYAALQHRLGDDAVRLLHSRFTGQDRLKLESELMQRMGLGSTNRQPVAAVATQTIEVSLNLDFDTIVSEPAPLDALAQRFGRVNRQRRRPEAPVHVLTRPEDGQFVYRDELVRNTLAVLRAVDGQPLDEAQISGYLDTVYGGGLAEELIEEVQQSRREFEESCVRTLRAFQSDDSLEDIFRDLFEGTEVLPASLEQKYVTLAQESVLEAQALLVPISGRQYGQLSRQKLIHSLKDSKDHTPVVDVPYHSTLGLRLDLTGREMPQDD